MRRRVLFSRGQLAEHLATKLDEVPEAIDFWNADRFLTLPEADITDQLIDSFRIDVPTLDRDKIELAPLRETYGTVYNEFGEPVKIRQSIITLMIPYSGDRAVFTLRPTAYTDSPPEGVVADDGVLLHWVTGATDPPFVRKHLDLKIDELARWLDWARSDVVGYNQRIGQLVPWLVQGRRAMLLASRNLESSLGFPISRRPDADKYTVPLIRKKISAKPTASAAAEPFEPEWVLADADYEEALRVLQNARNQLERSPSVVTDLNEMDIRDLLLLALNSQFEGAAAGEVFNFKGKTDILVRVADRNVFIGECKFWKGPKTIVETLDQLLGYLTWRDTKAAFLLFVRNADFSEVVAKALPELEAHPNFKRRGSTNVFGERHDFILHSNGDTAREVRLAFLPFALPRPRATRS
ncbi:hypothetical protein [Streptomyces sp. CdTB01]|uniref:hypothetical protein n=1 Tax=Streptomyces sp. CdTB01 TaxID=1725411 RepID=UPI00073A8CE1|nr:hypothetical protein [Streptomyces sp. CdTB01]ALV39157.1 hypothetical protein AS200_44380 [Streptomyces sp. CdTB01]